METGPTGKRKNCDTWADYEKAGTTRSSRLCHGGYYDGVHHDACPSKWDCMAATREKREGQRHLPVMNPSRSFSGFKDRPSSRVVGGNTGFKPIKGKHFEVKRPTFDRIPAVKTNVEKTVTPPSEYPEPLRTPFIQHGQAAPPPVTPIFLPQTKAEVVPRLVLNVVQGMLGSGAQQVMEYTRHVDIFGMGK